jgi:hypothetical protein
MNILKIVLYVLIGAVVLFLGIALLLPARYEVVRSAQINKPIEDVYGKVSDLQQWQSWNPWSKQEPSAKNTITGTGQQKGQRWAWEGKVVGKGSMTLTEATENKSVSYALKFEEPMQSEALNTLALEVSNGGTKVSWHMKGNLDYPIGRYFGLMMDGMIGKDFEDGLQNLKQELEKK